MHLRHFDKPFCQNVCRYCSHTAFSQSTTGMYIQEWFGDPAAAHYLCVSFQEVSSIIGVLLYNVNFEEESVGLLYRY